MTLDQLADATGLSTTLVTVCQVLGVSPGSVLESPDTSVVRLETAPTVSLGGDGIVERLLTPRNERELQIIHAEIDPGGHGEDEMYTIDCHVESVHVISGEFILSTPDQEHHLRPGDTLTLPGSEPHTWRNPADTPTRVLWILAKTRS